MFKEKLNSFSRRKTIEVKIGDIPMGGDHPVRIQSMTNTNNRNVQGTINQIRKIKNAGADYVRLSVPSVKDVEYLEKITQQLKRKEVNIPLIADVHFNPSIAEKAATIVEKVRINPGNYSKEQELKEKFVQLIQICRKNNTALRIGVNHGSLAARITEKYGDTPEGMVESAMEFLRICKEQKFDDVVVSMKSSNARVMVYAVRLLVNEMMKEVMHYPLHIGVTEAGEGEDGRIKSAVGIGALLADGIGDTIRVSLTEDPEEEIPVAKKIIEFSNTIYNEKVPVSVKKWNISFYNYGKRNTDAINSIGGKNVPVVISDFNGGNENLQDISPDILYNEKIQDSQELKSKMQIIEYKNWNEQMPENIFPVLSKSEYHNNRTKLNTLHFIRISLSDMKKEFLEMLKEDKHAVIVCSSEKKHCLKEFRILANVLITENIKTPLIFKRRYPEKEKEKILLQAACELGGLFIDGLGDGIWLSNGRPESGEITKIAFGILQAGRVRMSKTEYISCPSCARTMFNIQDTLFRIREKTSHLKNLKIGIMGCIVNGPGEMADADYGYVGSGKGTISLYKERKLIKHNVPEEYAVEELIRLIKDNGDWQEP